MRVIRHSAEKVFYLPATKVMPKVDGWTGKLDVGNSDMMQDLERTRHETVYTNGEYAYRSIGRRLKDRYNSGWHRHQVSTRQWSRNPAFIHPSDMTVLGLTDGDTVDIGSRRGAVPGVATTDKTLQPGVIAMAHGWADMAQADGALYGVGGYSNMLIDTTVDCDLYSAIPKMSDIPVIISKFAGSRNRTTDGSPRPQS